MYSIEYNTENTLVIKKSKFICKLYRIEDELNAKTILKELKNEYSDSSHICYSYIINNVIKNSDDKEPTGTAGLPIYNILKNNNLNMILCVVIRYFGGIKLGTGGLSRAYSSSVIETINKTNTIKYSKGYNIDLEFCYDSIKVIDSILKSIIINQKEFNNSIIYNFNISVNDYNEINSLLKLNSIKLTIKKEILVKI